MTIQKLYGRWFCGPYYGHVTTKQYFHCHEPSCPFSVKVRFEVVDGQKTAHVEKIVCDQHWHAFKSMSKAATRNIIESEKALIDSRKDVGKVPAKKHKGWQDEAKKEGLTLWKKLDKRSKTVDFACQRPRLSGRTVEQNTGIRCRGSQSTWPSAPTEKTRRCDNVGRPASEAKPSPFETRR